MFSNIHFTIWTHTFYNLVNLKKYKLQFCIIESWLWIKPLKVKFSKIPNRICSRCRVECELLFMDGNPFAIFQFNGVFETFILSELPFPFWESAAGCKIRCTSKYFPVKLYRSPHQRPLPAKIHISSLLLVQMWVS